MPQVSTFFGIIISIYYDDHPQPHFHAAYEGEEVQVRIADLSVMAGGLSPRAMGLVVEWAADHRRELTEDWGLAERHLPLNRIAGLR
jgi:hypothetical protein